MSNKVLIKFGTLIPLTGPYSRNPFKSKRIIGRIYLRIVKNLLTPFPLYFVYCLVVQRGYDLQSGKESVLILLFSNVGSILRLSMIFGEGGWSRIHHLTLHTLVHFFLSLLGPYRNCIFFIKPTFLSWVCLFFVWLSAGKIFTSYCHKFSLHSTEVPSLLSFRLEYDSLDPP